jgi:thioredoxin-like negative regulator of GroEL
MLLTDSIVQENYADSNDSLIEPAGVLFIFADGIATLSFHEGMTSMVHVALALMMAVTGATNEVSDEYDAACAKAEKEKKPLLVLVGASWCASCQVMKKDTIEPMKGSGELSEVVVAVVDKDTRPELAEQLMRGSTLPQVVMFKQDADGWKRYSLTGMQSQSRIRELLGRVRDVGRRQ